MKHLVILEGGGDEEFKIIGHVTYEWIMSPAPDFSTESSAYERVPEEARGEMLELSGRECGSECLVTSGSYDNDRAIMAVGKSFDSATKAVKWALSQGHELGDEYAGYLY